AFVTELNQTSTLTGDIKETLHEQLPRSSGPEGRPGETSSRPGKAASRSPSRRTCRCDFANQVAAVRAWPDGGGSGCGQARRQGAFGQRRPQGRPEVPQQGNR